MFLHGLLACVQISQVTLYGLRRHSRTWQPNWQPLLYGLTYSSFTLLLLFLCFLVLLLTVLVKVLSYITNRDDAERASPVVTVAVQESVKQFCKASGDNLD